MSTGIEKTVNDWMSKRPKWEQSLFEIASKGGKELTVDELKTVYEAFKIEVGLLKWEPDQTKKTAPTDVENPPTDPLSAEPEAEEPPEVQMLVGLTHEEGVNVLEPGSKLDFGNNLTVVFGRNGSGKSGFCRILRFLCSNQEKPNDLLGDVAKPLENQPPMRVSIHTRLGAAVSTPAEITIGETAKPGYLQHYSYYDTNMSALMDKDRSLAFRPPQLAQLTLGRDYIGQLESELNSEKSLKQVAVWKPKSFMHSNEITSALANLKDASKWEQLQKWCQFGDKEKEELKALRLRQSQLRSPEDLKLQRKARLNSLALIEEAVTTAFELISIESESTADKLKKELAALEEEAKQLEGIRLEVEPIQPIPSETWIQMIKSALAFSKAIDSRDELAVSAGGNYCPLCMQDVVGEAGERLNRFWRFISSKAQKEADKIKATLAERKRSIASLTLDDFSSEKDLRGVTSAHYPELAGLVVSFFALALERKRQLLGEEVIADGDLLKKEYDLIVVAISELEKAEEVEPGKTEEEAFQKMHESLEKQIDHLEDRLYLSKNIEEIERAKVVHNWIKLAVKEDDFRGRKTTYSNFVRDTAKQIVGKKYMRIYENLASELGVNVLYQPDFHGSEGQLVTNLEGGHHLNKGKFSPSQILSDGERRILSLIHTLVNFQLDSSAIGLIMDDPVCSIDREYMRRIALEICKLAKDKQIIIFTHDTLFCYFLAEAKDKVAIDFKGLALDRTFDGQNTGSTAISIFPNLYYGGECWVRVEACLKESKPLSGRELHYKLSEGFAMLRAAYEHLIESKLLGKVVTRWQEPIRTGGLKDLCLDPDIHIEVMEAFEDISAFIEAHFRSPNSVGLAPKHSELQKRFDTFINIRAKAKKSDKGSFS